MVLSRRSIAAACLLATGLSTAPMVHAQSNVQIYGVADVLLEYRNHMTATGASRYAVTSGGLNTSRWGLRGTEDLGNGLKAVFNLEGEVGLDTGAAGSTFWGRQANVGLQGDFGRVIAGRSYSTAYDFVLPFDPMGYAPFYSWATSAGAAGGRRDGQLTSADNIVKYEGRFGPVKLGASLSAGEGAAAGRYAALGAAYEANGFGAMLVVDQRDRITGGPNKDEVIHWGLSYQQKSFKVSLAQRQYKRSFSTVGRADNKSSMTWVGATWSATPQLDLTLAYYMQDIKTGTVGTTVNDPKLLALRMRYALSKRTWVYAVAANADAKSGVVSVSRDDVAFSDRQSSFGVGIQHRF